MHIFDINSQPSSDSSLTKVPSLQTTGSPQGTGFPSTSGQKYGIFGAALRGALRGLGNFFKLKLFSEFRSIRNYWLVQWRSIRNYWPALCRSITFTINQIKMFSVPLQPLLTKKKNLREYHLQKHNSVFFYNLKA